MTFDEWEVLWVGPSRLANEQKRGISGEGEIDYHITFQHFDLGDIGNLVAI